MALFTRTAVLSGGLSHMAGLIDLRVFDIAGTSYLFSGSEADGGLNVFALSPGGAAIPRDSVAYSGVTGTLGLRDISLAEVNGQAILLPAGRYDNRLTIHKIDATGGFDGTRYLGASTEYIGGIDETLVMQVNGRTFMVASQFETSGFRSFEIRNDLSLGYKREFLDTPDTHVGDIRDFASGIKDGRTYFFAVSAQDDGVSSYWIGKWGNIKERDSIGPADGLYVNAPTVLETVELAGKLFVLVGGTGSDTISVLRVDTWGGLFVADQVMDDLTTRFADVSAIDSFDYQGRQFVLAAGSDDGMSLFELSPDGRLFLKTSIADQPDTTLTNVETIETRVFGSEIQVFAGGSGGGITQFDLDLGNIGSRLTGTDTADTLTGTASDDLLVGFDGADSINGGGGDDLILDGAGADIMTGGAGADVFFFIEDGRMDIVTDFTPGVDKLDLSEFPLLYDIDRLTFTQKAYGVLITYGPDRFRIEETGDTLLVSELGNDDFIF